ncbi:signal transduction histidine kinase, nitrogen specific, NtrB [Chthoniobacter flavus Ellin428]|uniref:histidine kinase n=1 Tax=Chthoniobacter flavus Ellin428 TaxID=497964 RepID=B4D6V8_9BACT|nr:PAS domain S-box protein [Chthoniobacter flavus]EDY17909.1 signal transduction histidine kinase, nitrogen specific, NtrB [Chthoniobacter flavus Ellin428]TCO88516.1 PAS domain S-box-containing protein [Chthoniobacter flavus]
MKILIVDDIVSNRKLLRVVLEAEGYETVEAENGVEALRLLEREAVDVIVSDILMPRMDGYRLCHEVRANKRLRDIPFVVYTATYTSPADEKLCMDLGADKYLRKPASPHELVAAISEAAAVHHRPPSVHLSETEILKEYSERLVLKLEEKNVELQARTEELERSRAQSLLQAKVLETTANAVIITDEKGIIQWVNPAFTAMTGYTPEEAIGQNPRLLKSGEHDPEFYQRLWQTILSGQTWRGEFTNRRKDGSLYCDLHTISPVRGKDGEITHFVAVMNDVTENRRKEAAMRASETKFRSVFEAANDGMLILHDGAFTDANTKTLEMFGLAREQLIGATPGDISPETQPDGRGSREVAMGKMQNALAGEPQFFEWVLRRQDGRPIDVEVGLNRFELEGENYLLAITRDISERKRAAEKLGRSVERLNLATHAAGLGVWDWDVQKNELIWDDRMYELYGLKKEHFSGAYDTWIQHVHPEDAVRCDLEVQMALRGQKDLDMEFRIRWPNGNVRQIKAYAEVVRDAGGQPLRVTGVNYDITERRRADQRIREQAEMLKRAHEAIIEREVHTGLVTFWNEGAERLYGWSAAEAMGRHGSFLFADPGAMERITENLLAAGEWRGEVQHVAKDGRKLVVSSHVTLLRGDDGEPKSALVINIDITEQKKMEAQFLRAQRMESVGTLASGVAHDLNNILAPIMMSVPLLRQQLPPDTLDAVVSNIETCVERGARIVQQVLAFGRGLEGERLPLKIGAVIDEMMAIMRETFPKDITLECLPVAKMPPVVGDATQLHQVLLNLCVNARDAMPGGGKLRLSATHLEVDASYASMLPEAKPGPYVLLEVADSGSGIPPEVVERIFEPFFTTKETGKGTGLGLSTVHGIVRSHGGFIKVATEPGKGTTFQVYLPASPGCSQVRDADTARAEIPEGHGELILVVDDEAAVRESARHALEAFGYEVLLAADGTEALAVFVQNSGRIAAVLTDLMMPFMDGVALIHALRNIAPNTAVVASTGLGEKARLAELKALGIATVLRKPYGADLLLHTVHRALHPERRD